MKTNTIIQGDALEVLKTFSDKSVNCVMTSPPYWALRDYGIQGQLGLEPTFEEYINKLCDIFDEVKRVLRDNGICWVNLGDTYASTPTGNMGNQSGTDGVYKRLYDRNTQGGKTEKPTHRKKDFSNVPTKSLVLIPFRFTIEMINRGWILRNVIIWHKRNCMPSSVKDRFTVDFEYLFFFSKKKKYYFEQQREEWFDKNPYDTKRAGKFIKYSGKHKEDAGNRGVVVGDPSKGRNKRCVWTINPRPFKEAHFSVYPEELCETPIKAGCPKGGIVLDPFFGSGTTVLVALKQNKKFIGIELNKEYIEIAKKRLKPFLEQSKLP